MNKKIIEAQDMILERVNHFCREYGLNNIMAQLYVVLYFSGEPLSLNDMVERLRISKGSVSINIRALERYGAARRVWVKGSRKDYYEAEGDISKVIAERIKSMAQKRLFEVEGMINSAYAALNAVDSSGDRSHETTEAFKAKLEKLKDLRNKANTVFNLLNSSIVNTFLGTKETVKV